MQLYKKIMCVFFILFLGYACGNEHEDNPSTRQMRAPFTLLKNVKLKKNPVILKILGQISPTNLKATIDTLVSFETRHSLSDTTSDLRGIGAARRWIRQEFRKYKQQCGGRLQIDYDKWRVRDSRLGRPTFVNVVATLPSVTPTKIDRIVVICAHYDSRATDSMDSISAAPGANDDASGVAVVMELARIFSRYRFDATIIFAALAGEEHGLFGSTHLAEKARQNNWDIQAVLSLDMVGNIVGGNGLVDSTRLRCFSEAGSFSEPSQKAGTPSSTKCGIDSPSRQVARYSKFVTSTYLDDLSIELVYQADRFGRGGDHLPFNKNGYPAVRFTEPNENYSQQHQNVRIEEGTQFGDLPEFISVPYLHNVTRAVAAILGSMALSPAPPTEVHVQRHKGYNTKLSWNSPSSSHNIGGFAIFIRKSTSPVWQKQVNVNNLLEYTLKNISIDDNLFAVAAFDGEGNVGLPTYAIYQSQ